MIKSTASLISQLVKAGTSFGIPIYLGEPMMRKLKKKILVIGFYLGQLGLGGGIKLFVVLIFGDIDNCAY